MKFRTHVPDKIGPCPYALSQGGDCAGDCTWCDEYWSVEDCWQAKESRLSQQLRKTSVLRGESAEPHDSGEADTKQGEKKE